MTSTSEEAKDPPAQEHFKPIGTIFMLGVFVVLLILLWFSVWAILYSRGATA